MSKVIASITTSVAGYITGPYDGPEYGLGQGGERLHYWVMGGPWTYEGGHDFRDARPPTRSSTTSSSRWWRRGWSAGACTTRPR
jgi:hypothetical protein